MICSINRHIIKSVPILEKLTRPSMPGGPQLLHKLLYILEAKVWLSLSRALPADLPR